MNSRAYSNCAPRRGSGCNRTHCRGKSRRAASDWARARCAADRVTWWSDDTGARNNPRTIPRRCRRHCAAVAIGRKRMNWRRTSAAIVGCVVIGKVALPDVAAVFARRCQFITPRIDGLLQPAARRHFPFGFGRQPCPRPLAVSAGIILGNMHHGMIEPVENRARRSLWLGPIGMRHRDPPRRIRNPATDFTLEIIG